MLKLNRLTSKYMKNKGFITVIIGIIIALLVAGGGYYIVKKNRSIFSTSERQLNSPEINWSMFENNDLALSIKYPSSWTSFKPSALGIGGAVAAFGSSENAYGSWARPIPINESFVTIGANSQTISEIAKMASTQAEVIGKYNQENKSKGKVDYKIISQDQLTINGHRTVKTVTSIIKETPSAGGDISEGYFISYVFENKNKDVEYSYYITLWTAVPLTNTTKNQISLFEEMVKTFNYKPTNIEGAFRKPSSEITVPQLPNNADQKNENLKQALGQLRIRAEILYDDQLNYNGLCGGGIINTQKMSINLQEIINIIKSNRIGVTSNDQKILGIYCKASDKKYVATLKLNEGGKESGTWCVDATGFYATGTADTNQVVCVKK